MTVCRFLNLKSLFLSSNQAAMKKHLLLLCISFLWLSGVLPAQKIPGFTDINRILPEKDRAELVNNWLEWRLDNIIPELMHREGFDLWLIICRETNEDPVFWTLYPEPNMHARRTTMILFYDPGENQEIQRFCFGGGGGLYKNIWTDRSISQFEFLAKWIEEKDPSKIGINVSETFRSADGLSASLHNKLMENLKTKYQKRLTSAENLCIGWLETRSPEELSLYRHVCGIQHNLISEFYSNGVIIPDVTTVDDVMWWIRDRITELGFEPWFPPYINVIRHPDLEEKYKDNPRVIRRGDLIHCDIGYRYLRLCTDMQWHAYVCHIGEEDAPEGLKKALNNAVQMADIYMNEFEEGLSGRQIADNSIRKIKAAGLRPMLYSHPIGYWGHNAGCSIDTRPANNQPPGFEKVMEYPLYPNTVYAIEFSCTTSIPEWKGKDVSISYEEQGVFTKEGCHWVDGNQTEFFLIK